MKVSEIWVCCFLVATALLVFIFFNGSSFPNMEFTQNGDVMSVTRASRKLKGNGYDPTAVDLEDYRHRIDPVPSSKASIKPGPIEHGTPLNPYIPKPPSPPNHPKSDNGST
ncbi:hypothetical protein ERO13_A06G023200v2 [Gossypium hirsutum]|uniref:Uncharacterized protein n=4 Tax=Gossypium TaxID=3633 RepID=A0A2P5X3E0_GOSBA|nr:uncharacterized protein LOC107930538 [Gossypium hirsutum]KAB2076203.1 hypothetical protein ES319_A06G025800v1 [Gossypium barbadense]TYH11947.1 hypothetical protein ES288_A06G026700v1 [Gossypium darwinii]TYJ28795.1 hypothetical protein E1A91_A06G025000v1 [Gossypium mustelinum]KAG4193920.1 hypothetical protein ERO13_A06G023200v2 [Gossypium hirsutum]PPR97864.1 hypothetical protein GOBAR_AA22802 [Gossypium barbadense]